MKAIMSAKSLQELPRAPQAYKYEAGSSLESDGEGSPTLPCLPKQRLMKKSSFGRTCPPSTKTAAGKKVIKRPTKAMKRPASAKAMKVFQKVLKTMKKAVENVMKKSWPGLAKVIKKPSSNKAKAKAKAYQRLERDMSKALKTN